MSIHIRYTDGLFPSLEDINSLERKQAAIICPNPQMADGVRRLFDAQNATDFDVLTVAKATSELSSFYKIEGKALRKAELLMHFGTLWKSVHGATNFEMFIQSYQLFSEFRSFTTNFELVTEALTSLSTEQQSALTLYWRYLEQADIVDEHSLYELIGQSAEEAVQATEGDDPRCCWKNISFWGFPHLSGTQISLIKALGLVAEVSIFFPRAMIPFVHSSDYIAWLDKDVEDHLQSEANEERPALVESIVFAKKRLAGVLRENFKSEDLQGREILLCAKRPDFNLIQEIPFAPIAFKTPSEGLSSVGMGVIKQMREKYSQGIRTASDFHDFIESELSNAYQSQDFRAMRVFLQYKRLLENYHALSGLNESFAQFDLKLFEEIFVSTLPRMFTSALVADGEASIELSSLNDLSLESSPDVSLVIASSHYGPLKSKESYYAEEVGEFLSVVGPLKRSEFEFQFLKLRLRELISKNLPTIVIEKGLLESDPAWSDLLSCFDLQAKNGHSLNEDKKVRELHDFTIPVGTSPYSRTMSASSLQLYRDCPRKFYVSKIAKLDQFKELPIEIAPNELGTLEHELIGRLFREVREPGAVAQIVEEAIDKLLEEKQKKISPTLRQGYIFEVEEAVQNGLALLDQLSNELRLTSVRFDVKLQHKSGEADCILEWQGAKGQKWALLDFKRSKSSIGSKSEVEDLRKLQLPFYLHAIGLAPLDCAFIGYINLSNTTDSVLIAFDHELNSELSFSSFSMASNEYIEFSRAFLNELESECLTDTNFEARPLSAQTCTFCPISNICLKGGLESEREDENENA